MRILVTGASGFVGSATAAHLSQAGYEVIRAVGPKSGYGEDGLSFDVSELNSFPSCDLVGSLDAVVNCAGIAHRFGKTAPAEYSRVNVEGARNVARFAADAGAAMFIHLSSVLVYGKQGNREPIDERGFIDPGDEYARSKADGEQAVMEVCDRSGLRSMILRPAPIIGAGSKGNVHRLIQAIDRGRFLWVGDGSNRRSLVYVGDVQRAVECSLHIEEKSSVYNVVGDSPTMKEVVSTIAERLGKRVSNFQIPGSIIRVGLGLRSFAKLVPAADRYVRTVETWLADAVFSSESFKNQHGFVSQTSIEEALCRQVEYYLGNK